VVEIVDPADRRGEAVGTPFQRALGVRWSAVEDEPAAVAVELAVRPELCGPAGSLEGGVVATLADVAGAAAAARALGTMVATEHISISYLAPGRVGPVRAVGTPLRVGRRDVVAEVRVSDLGNESRLMAVALVTVRGLVERPADGA
jgi:uncharacterized protein (TIGR00369 family)